MRTHSNRTMSFTSAGACYLTSFSSASIFLGDHRPPGHSEKSEVTDEKTSRANTFILSRKPFVRRWARSSCFRVSCPATGRFRRATPADDRRPAWTKQEREDGGAHQHDPPAVSGMLRPRLLRRPHVRRRSFGCGLRPLIWACDVVTFSDSSGAARGVGCARNCKVRQAQQLCLETRHGSCGRTS